MNYLKVTVILACFLINFNDANAQLGQNQIVELNNYSNVAGTFHFDSPTGNLHFWTVEFIQQLYPEIEDMRKESETVYWEYSNNMVIVIYPREYIESPEFAPTSSPYNGPAKL